MATPADGYANLVTRELGESAVDIEDFQKLLGKLNWLVRASQPDIAFVVQKLSQFAHDPGAKHLGGAQRLLRYLSGTRTYSIKYTRTAQPLLKGYADADFASDQSCKSTIGYVFLLSTGAVTWSSKMQRSISTSTTEAEYYALAYAGKEVVWIRNLLQQLGQLVLEPTILYSDNQGGIALVGNPEFHARTKHIDVSIHYIKELAGDQMVNMQYIPTDQMLADCLTKPLKTIQHLSLIHI